MQEDVIIVLDERQQQKLEQAERLETELELLRFCAVRLPASSNLVDEICCRNPKVVVLDYILGDYGTAIDLISQLKSLKNSTSFLLWTDEPSLSVAVSTMKLGAIDYIELGSPRSLERVVSSILGVCREEQCILPPVREEDDRGILVFNSELGRQCKSLAISAAKRALRALVIYGEHGSGLSSIANLIHSTLLGAGFLVEEDLDLFTSTSESIFGTIPGRSSNCLLSAGSTVVLNHAKIENLELLSPLPEWLDQVTPKTNLANGVLIITTNSKELSLVLSRQYKLEVINVPNLKNRPEDFFPIVQYCIALAKKHWKAEAVHPSQDLISALQRLSWPGNISELRNCILTALAGDYLPNQEFFENVSRTESHLSKQEISLLTKILWAKSCWEQTQVFRTELPTASECLQALTLSSGNLRAAASLIGCSVATINTTLLSAASSTKQSSSQSATNEQS